MIDRNALLLYRLFPTEEQTEKDYLQHIVLKAVYENSSDSVVFKGGTALQKVYGLNRFSEDLDFTLNADAMGEIDDGLEGLDRYCDVINDVYEDRIVSGGVTSFLVRLRGPISIESITIDIVREHTLLPPKTELVRPVYGDPQPYMVSVMDEREMTTEKVRAILNRKVKRARDLYDLSFLLDRGGTVDPIMVHEKLKMIGIKFSYKEFSASVNGLESTWEDLGRYMEMVPPFRGVADRVLGKFKVAYV